MPKPRPWSRASTCRSPAEGSPFSRAVDRHQSKRRPELICPMAKKSSIEKNNLRAKLAKQTAPKRARLKALARDRDADPEERFEAQLKLAQLPRNSSAT